MIFNNNNMDTCGSPRHAKIAYAFKGVNVSCPLCHALDRVEEIENTLKRVYSSVADCNSELEGLVDAT
jgi:hypothetical protein